MNSTLDAKIKGEKLVNESDFWIYRNKNLLKRRIKNRAK